MKAVKIIGYAAWFFAAFLVGIYLTFPLDELKGLVVDRLEEQLGKGKQGAYGVDPKVELGSLTLSGFGVKATRVRVQLPSRDPDPGPTFELDKLKVGIRPWSIITKDKTVSLSADLYGGSVDAVLSMDDKGNVHEADLDVDDVDIGRFTLIPDKLGVPVTGKINAKAELDLGKTPEKDGEGAVSIDVKSLKLGPGNLKLAAAFGGFELPAIDLGNLTGEIPITKGKGTLQNVKLDGKDVQLELVGDLYPKARLGLTRLDLDGWFQPQASFLEREKKFKSLLELAGNMGSMGGMGSLTKAKDDEGHYWFGLKGTVERPSANLARDAGKHAKSKLNKGASGGKDAKG